MTQGLIWPAELERRKDGSVLVSFPDVPEATIEGETEAKALALAQDCLVVALCNYVEKRRPIPRPSPARGRATVSLPALTTAKIVLYGAMRAQGVSNTVLAARIGLSEAAVRRLLDLDHRSHIGQIETALRALGQQLTVGTRAA